MTQRIIEIIADTLGIEPAAIGPDASMDTMTNWDSVAHLNVIMSVEQEFHVRFDAEEIADARSVAGIEAALKRHGK